jgi:hypothetical protein
VPLFLDAFALAAERSSLSNYLAVVAISEVFELLPEPAETEEVSNLRGKGETPFGGTWWVRRPSASSIELSKVLDATANGAAVEGDRWRSTPQGLPSLLSMEACTSLLVYCSLYRSWGAIELAWEVHSPPKLSILLSGGGIVAIPREAADENDRWRSSPCGPPSLLSGEACISSLACWVLVRSWRVTKIAWLEFVILPSPWIVSSGWGEIIEEGASSSSGDAETKEPLAVSEFFPLVKKETRVCPPFLGLSLNLLGPGRAPRPAFLILWATRTNSSSLAVCESAASEQISIISGRKCLRIYWKRVHSDKGIMVYSDTHSGSREFPSPMRGEVQSMAEQRREYYMGEGGGFPRVRAVVSQMSSCCPWLVPTPRVFPKVN